MAGVIEHLSIDAHVDIPNHVQIFFDKYSFDPQRCVRLIDVDNNVHFLDCVERVEYDIHKNIVKEYSDDEWNFYGCEKGIINGIRTWVCLQSGKGILP